MKSIIYFIVAGAVLLSGLGTVIYFGIQPKSVPKINLSHMDTPGFVGQAVVQRLYLELKDAPVLLIGVWPGRADGIQVVHGILDHLQEPGLRYDIILGEPRLEGIETFPELQQVSIRDETKRFVDGIKSSLAQGHRVVAILPAFFSTQLLKEGPANSLRNEFQIDATSITIVPFPATREEEPQTPVHCMTGPQDEGGVGAFGCAVIHKARVMYRKKKDPSKWSTAMDLVGGKDYLLLVNPPKN